jgi:hypothetical protein
MSVWSDFQVKISEAPDLHKKSAGDFGPFPIGNRLELMTTEINFPAGGFCLLTSVG